MELVIKDVTRVMDINVNQSIIDFASKGRSGSIPQDSLEALNVVLKVCSRISEFCFSFIYSLFSACDHD